MLQRLRATLTSRKTVIALLILIFASVLVGGIVPQRVATSAAELAVWRASHPRLLPWAERLGLFQLFSTPWFAALLLVASLSLALSTAEQCRSAWRRTFTGPGAGGGEVLELPAEALAAALRKRGYVLMSSGELARFVRHPWGYWGNFLLHGGIVLATAASLYIAVTQQRGALTLAEGTEVPPQALWSSEERGVLAPPFRRDFSVGLERLRIDLGAGRGTQQPTAELRFADASEGGGRRAVSINALLKHRGVTIYQTTSYGDAFRVEFTAPDGSVHREELQLPFPSAADQAGYANFRLPWLAAELSAKYYADAGYRTLTSSNPLLFLRLMEGKRELARVSLKTGESGTLGEVRVRLVQSVKWTKLIMVRIAGIEVIFLGFFVICLGAALNYFVVPREITAEKSPGGYRIGWRAARFPEFYADEYRDIIEEVRQQ
ncbi:cytochrome c biogenesis protein ResB [Geomonas silvestris]|uniref:Cytochrome c biogenesis protein ResB n=1 Tax=Geomonas silvestris TaxID=2740184 RepID=A0A6V8ML98_9BACT|nr:cytochrome c biogenesis protein ResB [Geomonas silvestris]GFO60523.1 cytochrome c biogenesis protein ResB [Geomonas silvestris]